MRNLRISPNVRLVSIRIDIGIDVSGKRRRIIVDGADVFNRLAASFSNGELSGDAEALSPNIEVDDRR